MKRLAACALCASLYLCFAGGGGAQQLRNLTLDDLFRIEEIGDIAISPDGRSVAVVRRRPVSAARTYQQPFLGGNDRADVWLAPVAGGPLVNITKGEEDRSGFWKPTWSPDGARLALLSTKGGDNVYLYVWEKATGRLTKLNERGVSILAPPMWVDNRRLIAALLPDGQQPTSMTVERRAAVVAMREWPKTWAGKETTASVLDSGAPLNFEARRGEQLTLLDLAGQPQPIGTAGSVNKIYLAPGGRYFAFLKQVSVQTPDASRLYEHGNSDRLGIYGARYQLGVADSVGRAVALKANDLRYAAIDSFQWAPDGSSFAILGTRAGQEDGTLFLFRGRVDGTIDAVLLPAGAPRGFAWAGADRLLALIERDPLPGATAPPRKDWWLLSASGAPRNLSESLKTVPEDLSPDATGRSLVGVAADDLWRLRIEDANLWTNLTAGFEPKLGAVVWPSDESERRAGVKQMVLSAPRGALTDYYRVDLEPTAPGAGAIMRLALPSEHAALVGYRPGEGDLALFKAEERTGTTLTLARGAERRALIETNAFLREVAQGELKKIEYRGLDGDELKAWMILPPGYESGKGYPMVTWVYAGSVARDAPSILTRINFSHGLNLQLMAARGYVVLLPSMPLPPEPDGKRRFGSDPYMELTKGVLPAIDKAIDLGVADPKRLAVMGQSYGGYSTYGLITQTNRFQAAISLAGLNDLISLYGIFDARGRYEPFPHEDRFRQSIAETGQTRMGNPPWKDWSRYLRNSPLFYVDRVQTPLLIIQGDMDYVAMQQGEEFFTGLYRQGKRARFVRYWGEGHVFTSPANIRDMWTQIDRWLVECFTPPSAPGDKLTKKP